MDEWQRLIKKIRRKTIYCFFCQNVLARVNKFAYKLVIHHIDGNQNDNDKANLIVLCQGCHKRLHMRIYKRLGIKFVGTVTPFKYPKQLK